MEEKLGSGPPGNKLGANISALVDKSLGNYSGPFDVFRELIQNADDAEAKKIEIHFLTENSGESCDASEGDNVYMWTIRDNGGGLDKPQWDRLCTIGDGNQELAKVGTFGVGFYTVLGVCDNPRVRSKGRSLQIQRSEDRELRWKLEPCESDGWTSVELVLKTSVRKRLPHLPDIARFLISSITFLERVETITVFLADREILSIKKNLQAGSPVQVPVTHGESGIMTIESINAAKQFVSVHAKEEAFLAEQKTLLNETTADVEGFAPSSQAPNQRTTSQASECMFEAVYFLYTARIKPHPPKEMKEEVMSITKGLPSDFSCEAVYFDAEQRDLVEGSSFRHLFDGSDGILPQKNRSGRIFIGQSTKESTSIGLHIASKHIVPDVVRSSVRLGSVFPFANIILTEWNESLLNIAGHLARAIYEQEMRTASKLEPSKVEKLGLYTMQQFGFERYPTCGISLRLKSGFFSTPEQSVLSNHGISHVSFVRRYNKGLHTVLKKMPHLHAEVPAEQWDPTDERTIIKRCGRKDMVEEFTSCHLSEADMEYFLGWWGDNKRSLRADDDTEKKFFDELRDKGGLSCEECGVIKLQRIKQYTQLTHDKDLLPPETIYIRQPQVYAHYLRDLFGWEPLDPVLWLKFVCKHDDADPEKAFDSRILTILSGSLGTPATPSQEWEQAKGHLASFACISTNCGFRKPGDSYFKISGIWDDIPVVNDRTLNNRVYELLGVRLLKRLEESTDYTNDRFLPYLADMVAKGDLSEKQIGQLRRKKVFDSEKHGKLTAVALHQPDGLGVRLREHGLPILSLHGTDGVRTDLLNKLGFRVYPPLEEVDKWLASRDKTKADLAEQCLSDNGEEYCEEAKQPGVAMIPTKAGSLVHLNEVVSCPIWEEMGFHMISLSLAKYAGILGVKDTPPPDILIERLETKAPSNIRSAQIWIKQLSQNTSNSEFGFEHIQKLGEVRFVPFETYPIQPNLPSTTHQCLKDCFLGDGGDSLITLIVKKEPPTASDIATAMVACPRRFLELAPDDRYHCLQDIAKEFDSFSGELQMALRKSPILLWRHMPDGPYGEEPKQACEILIGGDKENLRDFCQSVPVAPDGLKALYEKLGSESLDSCVIYEVCATDEELTNSSTFKPNDIIQCVNTLKKKEPELEFPDDIFTLAVKTCKKLELHKVLKCLLGAFPAKPREVTAGLSKDPITLYIVKDVDKKAIYTDTATALCRKLFKTYSPRDVLAMQLLLMNEESRMDQDHCGDSPGLAPHEDRQHRRRRFSPSSTHPTLVSRLLKSMPKKHKASVVYPKIDPTELAKQAISPATQTADPSKESQKWFRELLTGSDLKRKDVYCGQIDTELDSDKKSHYPERLGEVMEEFAQLVVSLADVFKKDRATFRIFWKNSDPNLMAFNHKRDHIYLNLAHYLEYHYKKVDEKRFIMEWYLIFAHELAHNVSFQHDELHERTFAGLCITHIDALRKRFPNVPPLGSM
ncbi:hypothetical protein EV363DRAFT_1349476 [Boletus edulis]|nr:hypothetical protein EV363DRAFT_1349476 [Boletus edulis]